LEQDNWTPCLGAWHGSCYRQKESNRFPIQDEVDFAEEDESAAERRIGSRLVEMETIGSVRFSVTNVTFKIFRSEIRAVIHGMSFSWYALVEPI
jgi:hypothetical protein